MHCQDSGRIRVTAAELEAYWQHVASRARANGEAVPEGFDKRAVPMGLYGDDARYNLLGSKILLITLNSILESHRRVSVAQAVHILLLFVYRDLQELISFPPAGKMNEVENCAVFRCSRFVSTSVWVLAPGTQ